MIMPWPTKEQAHLTVTIEDAAPPDPKDETAYVPMVLARMLTFRCPCGSSFTETIEVDWNSQRTAREMERILLDRLQPREPRTAGEVRASHGFAWRAEHEACGLKPSASSGPS